jgi:hypothetical protein
VTFPHSTQFDERDEPAGSSECGFLREILEQLERDPEERWHAMEGLGLVEPDVRLAVIGELSRHQQSSATESLLRLLCSARDLSTRAAARAALGVEIAGTPGVRCFDPPARVLVDSNWNAVGDEGVAGAEHQLKLGDELPDEVDRGIAGSLITPVDGRGCGSIAISASQRGQRRTAAFLCDVRRGIRDVVGEVETERRGAGRLIDELGEHVGDTCIRDVPELALRLLAGCLMLSGAEVALPVRDWLAGILGPDFQPAGFPASIPGLATPSIAGDEIPARAVAILDACPTWIDTSPLTCELAREILLREGKVAADPDRDAGAYRYLFEHRLIHRLDLYGRMLLWMAWLWWYAGETELAESAQALAVQIADEQYAVPSHAFTVALTTRSLEAAQAEMLRRTNG